MRKKTYIIVIVLVAVFLLILSIIQSLNVINIVHMRQTIFTYTINDIMNNVLSEINSHYNIDRNLSIYSDKPKNTAQKSLGAKQENLYVFKEINKETRVKEIHDYLGEKRPYIHSSFYPQFIKKENKEPSSESIINNASFTKGDICYISSVIQKTLNTYEIDEKYEFGIYCPHCADYLISSNKNILAEMSMKGFAYKCLITHNQSSYNAYFVLYFPPENKFLAFKSNMIIWVSVISIALIYSLFLYTFITTMRLKNLQQARDDFVKNITHEFKTPIATVSLAAEILKDKDIIEENNLRENYLNIITLENKRLEQMVETILSNTISSNQMLLKLNLEVADINVLVEQAIDLMHVILEERKGRIICLKAKEPLVYVDKEKIIIAIKNILDNAIKYNRNQPFIRVELANKKNKILISIMDNGIGMAKNQANKVFDRLFRISTGDVHNVKGYGLGLNYVKSIIRMHGGKIKVESEINKGSTFKIYLPIKQNVWKQKEKF